MLRENPISVAHEGDESVHREYESTGKRGGTFSGEVGRKLRSLRRKTGTSRMNRKVHVRICRGLGGETPLVYLAEEAGHDLVRCGLGVSDCPPRQVPNLSRADEGTIRNLWAL